VNYRSATYAALLLGVASVPAAGQPAASVLPDLLPRAREVALARSAAPPEVSADATVLVLERGGFVVADQGSNGVTCLVDRSQPRALEPHCYDREASVTILPIRVREAELREQGWTKAEVAADIDAGIRAGRFRLPARAAMTYMMSSAQVLYDEGGAHVGAWKPHLMIYMPFLKAADLGLSGAPSTRAAMVVDEGTALASILVIVAAFVDPEEPAAGR
jgi:hypothetical protein